MKLSRMLDYLLEAGFMVSFQKCALNYHFTHVQITHLHDKKIFFHKNTLILKDAITEFVEKVLKEQKEYDRALDEKAARKVGCYVIPEVEFKK